MGSTREYVTLMKFQNDCYRVDVMDAGVLTADGTKMKDAVADAKRAPEREWRETSVQIGRRNDESSWCSYAKFN